MTDLLYIILMAPTGEGKSPMTSLLPLLLLLLEAVACFANAESAGKFPLHSELCASPNQRSKASDGLQAE